MGLTLEVFLAFHGDILDVPARVPCVLIVDDIETNRLLMKLYLRRRSVQVLLAESGSKALDLVKSQLVDIVFMDLHIPPGIDGCEAMRQIRGWERESGTRPTYAVALSAAPGDTLAEEILKSGFDEYLMKSSNFDLVLAAVDRILKERMDGAGSISG